MQNEVNVYITMKYIDDHNIRKLSKIIYKTNVMPSGKSDSFLRLSEHLLNQLQNDIDLNKVQRIVSGELIRTYGLEIPESQSRNISEIIYNWYHE